MRYEVPIQDLSVDLSRIPALPKSGFVMTGIRPA
jgi:fatty-acid peroxygenase